MRPAFISDDLPQPDGPTTAMKAGLLEQFEKSINLTVAAKEQFRFVAGKRPKARIRAPFQCRNRHWQGYRQRFFTSSKKGSRASQVTFLSK